MANTARALVYRAPYEARIEAVDMPPLTPSDVEVETTFGAVSRGTERLVFEGRVPRTEHERMRAPFQAGAFPFPVRYGYACVGRVVSGPDDRLGQAVFALHPHQTRFRVPGDAALTLPPGVPETRAVLAANVETALNAVWDAELMPGQRVLVVGAGLVGALVALVAHRVAGTEVFIIDKIDARAEIFTDIPVTFCSHQCDLAPPDGFDVAFHATASAEGLQTAIDSLRFEGQVIELSWFGDRPVPVRLGGAFHANRLSIRCSQVGHVAPSRRAQTTHRQRLAAALALLDDSVFDRLVTHSCPFDALPDRLGAILAPDADGIATRITY